VVLAGGLVQQIDTPLKLYNEPANLFVAGFLGSPPMNFINGILKREGDAFLFSEIHNGTIQLRLPGNEWEAAREFVDKPILLGIRPEDLELAQFKGDAASTASFPAIVDLVEPMGAETNLYLQTGAHTVVCRSQRALENREVGRRQQFELNLRKARLFDPSSARRVI